MRYKIKSFNGIPYELYKNNFVSMSSFTDEEVRLILAQPITLRFSCGYTDWKVITGHNEAE